MNCTIRTLPINLCYDKNIYYFNKEIPYDKAMKWDEVSEKYNQSQITRKRRNKKYSPYVMGVPNNWMYAEDFQYYPNSHRVIFQRSSDESSNKGIFLFILISIVYSYCGCTMSVSSSSFQSTNNSNVETVDQIAILGTRGYKSIYHHIEYILNFIHYSLNIQNHPLVLFILFLYYIDSILLDC